jgi:hypothetical protein
MRTYYIFIDEEFSIFDTFNVLKETRVIEPGIDYIDIKETPILPPYIVVESIYKDEYFKSCLIKILKEIGYDKSIQILKPLVKEVADIF